MRIYDLYGFEHDNLEVARIAIEQALGINFNAHESMYMGGEYYRWDASGKEVFVLTKNYNSFEEELNERDFPKIGVLFYVSNTQRSQKLEKLLKAQVKKISLLRRETMV